MEWKILLVWNGLDDFEWYGYTSVNDSVPFHVFKMATNWKEDETLKLIELWGDGAIQAMLEGSRRNKDVFLRISRSMGEAGYEKTGDQCSCKIKKLRLEYRKIKDKKGKTGTDYKEWKYFEVMDSALGHKAATQPPIVVESSENVTTVEEDALIDESGVELSFIEDVEESEPCSSKELSRSRSETPASMCSSVIEPKKKRKKGSDKMDKFDGIIEKMIKLQEESDKNYLKLEEKLLEMDEQRQ